MPAASPPATIDGSPMAIKSDWPSNYGQLGDSNKTYNAHLIAIDYSAGVEDEIPEATLKAYCRNADMWDCASAILVPFADQDPDPKFRDYMYNPLEVFDQQSARDVAAALATLDESTFFEKHGAFYCAEGQYVVANLGPQEDENGGTLLKKSRYGDTAFGRLIANFIAAPGYAGMSAEQREKNPADRLGLFAGARPRQWRHHPHARPHPHRHRPSGRGARLDPGGYQGLAGVSAEARRSADRAPDDRGNHRLGAAAPVYAARRGGESRRRRYRRAPTRRATTRSRLRSSS